MPTKSGQDFQYTVDTSFTFKNHLLSLQVDPLLRHLSHFTYKLNSNLKFLAHQTLSQDDCCFQTLPANNKLIGLKYKKWLQMLVDPDKVTIALSAKRSHSDKFKFAIDLVAD